MIKETSIRSLPGYLVLLVLLALSLALVAGIVWVVLNLEPDLTMAAALVVLSLALLVVAVSYAGLTIVNPNEAKVGVLFGTYIGSLKTQGFWWVNPLTLRRKVSVRIRNFQSDRLKVNDRDGNPIEIASVVVWRVTDTAEALFQVDDYEDFVHIQTESALRILATSYPYDAHEGELSLRGNPHEVTEQLRQEIQNRLEKAGVEVIEARISHLAYAPEIANAMLRRQQANAVIAARTKIVEGAVGMVEMALDELSKKQVVELDEERKAQMVSNLLVVLCSEHETQPVVNTGTIYQ